MPTFSPLRAGAVMLLICGVLVGMTGRVAYLQTYGRQKTVRFAERQQHVTQVVPARRGTIFDRNGLPMAATLLTHNLYVDPKFMLEQYQRQGRDLNRMDEDLRKVCKVIEGDADKLTTLLVEQREKRFVKIAEDLTDEQVQEIAALNIPGAGFEPVAKRFYPMGPIASHVLGTVGNGPKGEVVGLEGLELQFEKQLAGENGSRRLEKDAHGRAIGIDAGDDVPPTHGRHLVLTIDANIQMLAEQELYEVCKKYKAKAGEVIVMDPHSGEVLAMASYPTFNPQNLEDSRPEDRTNRCIVVPYEPGSTLKPFLVGPALAQKQTTLHEVWKIPGPSYTPYGSRHISDVHYNGPQLCTWDVLVKSSNIGMSLLAERMGNPLIYQALKGFRFGERTGIDLPGEDDGRVRPLNKWSHFSTESVAQGYEMMVTPIQLARGFCAYANGGRLITPHVVKGTLDTEGNIAEPAQRTRTGESAQAVDAKAAAQVRQALSDVVIRGTAQGKGSKYWNIFGKTGTAHISRHGVYISDLYNSSFLAGALLEDPRIVVAMIVHEPDRSLGLGYFGGTVSGPPAVRLVERTLGYMQVPTSPPLKPPPPDIAGVLVNYDAKKYEQTGQRE